jgi:hypothetical protein
MLSVAMVSVLMLSVVMLNVFVLNVLMPSVVMVSVIVLSVTAPMERCLRILSYASVVLGISSKKDLKLKFEKNFFSPPMALYLTCDDTVVNYHEIDHLKLSYPLRDESSDSDGDSDEVTI